MSHEHRSIDIHRYLGHRPDAGHMLFERTQGPVRGPCPVEIRHLPGDQDWELSDPFEPGHSRFYHLRATQEGILLVMIQHIVARRDYMNPPLLYMPRILEPEAVTTSRARIVTHTGDELGEEILRVQLLDQGPFEHPFLGHLEDTIRIELEYDNGPAGLDTFTYRAMPGLIPISGHRIEDTPRGKREVHIELMAAALGDLRLGEARALQQIDKAPSPPHLQTIINLQDHNKLLSLLNPLRTGAMAGAGYCLEAVQAGDPAVISFRKASQVVEWVLTSYPDDDAGYLQVHHLHPLYLCLRPGNLQGLNKEARLLGEVLRRILLRSLFAQ